MKARKALLVLLASAFLLNLNAQEGGNQAQIVSKQGESSASDSPKGSFFIIPFYGFTMFQDLRLTSHTNNYKLWEGESTSQFSMDEIDDYNNDFDTRYMNSMTGLTIGYQVLDGLGIGLHAGVNHFKFETWISDENSQILKEDYPALTLGLSVDYQKKLNDRLTAMAILSYNYCITSSVVAETNSGESVVSSKVAAMYGEINLALGYRLGRFMPYGGAGFSSQIVHSVVKEQIPTTDGNGNPFNNLTDFDTSFRGEAIYGFAGVNYQINKKAAIYLHGSLPNPGRVIAGLRLII